MSLSNEIEVMLRSDIFRGVASGRCKLIAMSSERLVFQPGDKVYEIGEPSKAVYFVLSGKVSVQRSDANLTMEVGQFGPGAIFGEIGVLLGRVRVVTVVALEQCEMLKLDGRVFVEVLNQVPDVALALVRELALRLDVVTSRMLQPPQIT